MIDLSYCFIMNRKEAIIEINPKIEKIIEIARLFSEEPIMIPITTAIIPNTNNPPILSNELKVDCVLAAFHRSCVVIFSYIGLFVDLKDIFRLFVRQSWYYGHHSLIRGCHNMIIVDP